MAMLVDTIEGRLQVKLGQLTFENEVLRQQLDDKSKEVEDLKSELERFGRSGHEGGK